MKNLNFKVTDKEHENLKDLLRRHKQVEPDSDWTWQKLLQLIISYGMDEAYRSLYEKENE